MKLERGIDPDTGRIVVSRRDLASLLGIRRRSLSDDPPTIAAPDRLVEAGLVLDGSVAPELLPAVEVLRAPRARASLRRWRAGVPRMPVELIVGARGVIILPTTTDSEQLAELTWMPRPSAVAVMLSRLLDLPATDGRPPIDPGRHHWDDVMALALDPDAGVEVADLRWAQPAPSELGSLLVLCWNEAGGISQLRRPADLPHDDQTVDVAPIHPIEVWVQLTTLARAATQRPVP